MIKLLDKFVDLEKQRRWNRCIQKARKKPRKEMDAGAYKNMKKIIIFASLALAVVSCYTTAEGLLQYVFQNKWWQAALISCAIQASLFVLNLKLFYFISNKFGMLTVILWILLLSASCSFSYVYISQEVYPETLYNQDADRILMEESTKICYQLEEYIDGYSLYLKQCMSDFSAIDIVENAEDEIHEIGNRNKNALANIQIKIPHFAVGNEKYDGIEIIMTGIDNSITACQNNMKDQDADIQISELEKLRKTLSSTYDLITAQESNWNKGQTEGLERLKEGGFDTSSTIYEGLNDTNEDEKAYVAFLSNFKAEIRIKKVEVENYISELKKAKSSVLTEQKKKIRVELEKENPNGDELQKYISALYTAFLEEGDDEIIQRLDNFKIAVNTYKELQKQKEQIQTRYTDLDSNEFTYIDSGDKLEQKWIEMLSSLKSIVQNLPVKQTLIDHDKMKENAVIDIDSIVSIDRMEKIEQISELERRYLSELNDFEKAFNLLLSKYNVMAIYSLVFAIVLDALGAFMGIFLATNEPSVE